MPPRLLLLAALFLFAGDAPSETESRPEILTYRSRHWILQLPAELAARRSAESWGAAADRRLEEIAGRLGVKLAGEPLHLYLDDSTRRLEERSGSDAPFTLLPDRREVAHLIAPDGTITDASGDAFLLLHLAWGPPPSGPLAAAVARFGAGDFHGQPLPVYAARVIREEEPYTLREILRLVPSLDKNEGQLSPLVCDALGGAWVEHLRARRGPGVLRRLWTAQAEEKAIAAALGTSWESLEKDWRTWLESRPAPPRAAPIPNLAGFLRGISFSHEVRREGYGSDAAAAQLARIRALGANAVSIVPYGFTRAPDEPIVRYLGTDESEDRILRTMEQARRQGLKTVLKPQLWAPRRFTGDIVFERPADFDRWWAGYRRWMLHHARVAALGRADVLVIGTELGGVTRHRDAWRGLIRDVRRIYPGPLTYAANWAGDFETMPFWGDLDLLGLNMYYPLAGPGEMPRADSPRVRELRTKLAAMARRYGKPVLFTEVGYAASAAAAAEPWKEDHGPLDPAMQARCYEVVFEAFSREPWLAGLFWWKWPSHGQGSADDPSFSPLGKPALGVLERWYAPTPGPSPAKRERGEG
ncbi:MAG TPA: hypothetical protein VKM72_06590 [Thermoanaerobaculia bacterium]|nr:hypothetical protein [Thermoanaerobaculia bacterium]